MPKILIKRGTNPVGTQLDLGEFGFKHDTNELYLGKGVGNDPIRISTWKEYSANYTVLAANTAEQPAPVTLNTNTVLGRLSGNIVALTGGDIWTIINGQNTTDIDANNFKIINLADPVNATDAVNKQYVDNLVTSGLTAHEAVLDKDLTAPPASPNTGDRYWIAPGATGDWAGHDYEIAEWNGSAWDFEPVTDGDFAYVTDEDVFYFYDEDETSGDKRKPLAAGMGNTSFIALIDTPSSYAGHGGEVLFVNDTEDGVEFRNVIDGGTLV